MTELIIFAVVNTLTSTLSGASGIGGAIISTPLLVLLGLNPAQAIATAKFSGLGLAIGASGRFFKEGLTDKRTVIIFSVVGGVAALFGSLALAHFRDYGAALQIIMALGILLIGIPMLYFRNLGLEPKLRSRKLKILGLFLLLIGVALQVVLSAGIGTLQMFILIGCFGMTTLVASATRRAMQLTVATISLAVFMSVDLVDYKFGLVSLVTALIGGYVGAHLAVSRGNKFVTNLFAFVGALLAIQLLLS